MFLRNSLYTNRYKIIVNTCCRLLNTQLKREPLAVITYPYNSKLDVNDKLSKLSGINLNHKDIDLDEVPEIETSLVPKKFFTLKQPATIKYSFAVDDHVAEKVANIINGYIAKDDLVLEANAGLGLITHHLLKSKAKKLYLGQSEELNIPSLQNLIASNTGRIEYVPLRNKYETILFRLINEALKLKCESQKLKAVSVVNNGHFFLHLCSSIIKGCNWHYLDDVEFYLIIRPRMQQDLFSNKYKKFATHTIVNSLMNCQMLCELPRESFLPWPKTNESSMFLYRITKNPNAFNVIKKEEYSDFYKFLKIVGRKKYGFIIPTLEHWAPGCGLELTKLGISTWTQVKDVTPEQACDLYQIFKSTPGYDNYKMVLSNDHKGLALETEEYDKLQSTEIFLDDVENLQNIVEIT